jgi:hypothetical protein
MMAVEQLSADLSALAVESRAPAPALEKILPHEQVEQQTLPELAARFADFVGRGALGAILLTRVTVMLAVSEIGIHTQTLRVQAACDLEHTRWWASSWLPVLAPWSGSAVPAIIELGIAVLLAGIARRYAVARFARIVDGPDALAAGRRFVTRAEPWFVALWTSGIVAYSTVFGAAVALQMWYVPEAVPWTAIACDHGPWLWQQAMWWYDTLARYRDMCCVVSIAAIASVMVARRRPMWLASRSIARFALLLALGGLVGAMWLCHVDDSRNAVANDDIWRMLAVLGGGLALFVSLASFALRSVHRRK